MITITVNFQKGLNESIIVSTSDNNKQVEYNENGDNNRVWQLWRLYRHDSIRTQGLRPLVISLSIYLISVSSLAVHSKNGQSASADEKSKL